MRIMVNPTKLLYFENSTNTFRLGNFPETGNVIEIEHDKAKAFFEEVVNPKEHEQVICLLKEMLSMTHEDACQSVEYLIESNILIDADDYDNMCNNEKYCRQNLYFYMVSNGRVKQALKKLKNKKILILGVGGVGSIVAEMLIRAGFSNLTIVDNDVVENSNLIRQLAYVSTDVGSKKIDSLEKRLKLINSEIKINKYDMFIEKIEDVLPIIEKSDFVVNTLDKPERKIRRLINLACVNSGKPVIFAGFAEHVAMVGPFVVPNKTACLNCNDIEHDQPINKLQYVPSYGPICGIIANIVTDEIVNYFIKYKKTNLKGKTLMYNMYNHKTTIKKWKRNDKCLVCGGVHDS